MSEIEITIENVCGACGKGPCGEPCEKWYAVLCGEPVIFDGEEGKQNE